MRLHREVVATLTKAGRKDLVKHVRADATSRLLDDVARGVNNVRGHLEAGDTQRAAYSVSNMVLKLGKLLKELDFEKTKNLYRFGQDLEKLADRINVARQRLREPS